MFDDFDLGDWGADLSSTNTGGYDQAGMDALTGKLSGADGYDYSQMFGGAGSTFDSAGALALSDAVSGFDPSLFETTATSSAAQPSVSSTGSGAVLKSVGDANSASSSGGGNQIQKLLAQAPKLIQGKDGNLDLTKVLKMSAGLASIISGITKPVKNAQSASQLQAQLVQPNNSWTPQQKVWSDRFFNTPASANRGTTPAASRASSIVPSRGYATGGSIEGLDSLIGYMSPSIREALMSQRVIQSPAFAEGGAMPGGEGDGLGEPMGALGLTEGPGGGQDDMIDAKLSPGEYVFDADTVSALGDGSNEAGAAILDEWRQNIRAHKRSAPPDEIPPEAEHPDDYLPGAQ